MSTVRKALHWYVPILLLSLASAPLAARAFDDPVVAANVFRSALQDGNAALALSLLAPEVLIYESGDEQTSRQDYAAAHLKADIRYLDGFYVEILSQKSYEHEGLAWVTTRSRYLSKSADPPTRQLGTETLLLRRQVSGWQIVHVHWSSSAQESPP